MRRTGPCLAVVLFAACAAIALSACGADKTPIARVGDRVITKADLKHLIFDRNMPDPPTYAKCIARMRAQPGSPSDTATLRGMCHYEYMQIVTGVLATLIHSEWVQQEAKADGVTLTKADLKKAGGDKNKLTSDDRRALLDEKLKQKLAPVTVSEAETRAVYAKWRGIRVERRTVLAVVTARKADASAAHRLLDGGQTFALVAQRYASDWRRIVGSGGRVGLIPDVTQDPQADPGGYDGGAPLRQAVFMPNSLVTLIGPLKSGRGWYVVEPLPGFAPLKPLPGTAGAKVKPSYARLRPELEQDIKDAKQNPRFEEILRRHWLAKTTCEKGYIFPSGLVFFASPVGTWYSQSGCGNFVPFKSVVG